MHLIEVLFLFLPCVIAFCPDNDYIRPCTCRVVYDKTSVVCESLKLPHLTKILRHGFCGLELHSFYLMSPDIDYLPSNLFIKNIVYDFQVYNANISHFTQAGRSAFYGQETYLNSLSMRRCNLKDDLKWEMIGELRALTYLDLTHNLLRKIPKQWFFHPPPNLRSLILKENEITNLESGAFRFMHKLNELDLSSNKISEIRRDIFPYPGNELIFLRLSDNRLHSLPEDLFDEMLGLRRIYLDNNRLTTLAADVWKPIWGELERLELYGNPIKCDCSTQWVTELRSPRLLYGTCDWSFTNDTNELKNLIPHHFDECS